LDRANTSIEYLRIIFYYERMTLKERNVFFKIGLGVAGAALAALGLASVAILPSAQSV
jgi:hypothetical protein